MVVELILVPEGRDDRDVRRLGERLERRPARRRRRDLGLPPDRRWVLIVGDDPQRGASRGPEAFNVDTFIRFARIADVVVIDSAGPDPAPYAYAGLAAMRGRSVLMIETQLAHHAAWFKLAREHAPRTTLFVDISPPDGAA